VQLRETLWNVESRRSRCWRDPNRRGACCTIRLRGDTLSDDTKTVVPVTAIRWRSGAVTRDGQTEEEAAMTAEIWE
jgi:hypothetical protein